MASDTAEFFAAALKRVGLNGSFAPADIGKEIGLSKAQSEAAARSLSNDGVLELGFDCSAHFSPDFRKMKAGQEKKVAKPKKPAAKRPRGARAAAAATPAVPVADSK